MSAEEKREVGVSQEGAAHCECEATPGASSHCPGGYQGSMNLNSPAPSTGKPCLPDPGPPPSLGYRPHPDRDGPSQRRQGLQPGCCGEGFPDWDRHQTRVAGGFLVGWCLDGALFPGGNAGENSRTGKNHRLRFRLIDVAAGGSEVRLQDIN